MVSLDIGVVDRFWRYVKKTDQCWLWDGYRTSRDRGVIEVNGKNRFASRISWEIHNQTFEGRRAYLVQV